MDIQATTDPHPTGTPAAGTASPEGAVRLVLASASPARRQRLADAGIPAQTQVSGVDEGEVTDPDPDGLCATLARRKAEAVARRLREQPAGSPAPGSPATGVPGTPGRTLVLGCDSVLAFDGRAWGKPTDAADAVARWRRMRGRAGVLHTGHALVEVGSGEVVEEVGRARVFFADISDAEIDAYVASGEPLHVAGAFTIDGRGAPFVERIEGDPGTVIGLSMPLLRRLLAGHGVAITALWRDAG